MVLVLNLVLMSALLVKNNVPATLLTRLASKTLRVVMFGVHPKTVPPAINARMVLASGLARMNARRGPSSVLTIRLIKLALKIPLAATFGARPKHARPATSA
jgi:hypothetical protein